MTVSKNIWSKETETLVKALHEELILNNHDWHKLKTNKNRRAAELLTSAISQIINNGKQTDIEALIEQSLRWIKEEVKDPGCPSH